MLYATVLEARICCDLPLNNSEHQVAGFRMNVAVYLCWRTLGNLDGYNTIHVVVLV